jgi:hypothetical protein
MNRQRRRKRARERRFRVEAVPRQSPDLHKLAQVFLGMALARAEEDRAPAEPPDAPRPREQGEVE